VPPEVDLPLFPDVLRSDPRPQRAAETSYQFLQRVDDPVFARVRATFNQWVGCFASVQEAAATRDLLGRFRSKQDLQFYAAFWELYLHEIHVRLGFEVRVHPLSQRGTRPDFLMSRQGQAVYLEAVMPSASSGAPAGPKGITTIMEYVNEAYHPDFFLKIRFVSPGTDLPKKTEIVAAVQTWLSCLNWDEWWRGGLSPEVPYPEAELPVRDWILGLRALPRAPQNRADEAYPMVGIYPSISGWPDAIADELKPKLDEKANKYGDLDAPYVVAVWIMSAMASALTTPQALFGLGMPLEEGRHTTGLPSVLEREGLWTANRQHRGRVSAVLAAVSFEFNYSAVSRVLPRLWLSPWATRKLGQALPFPTSRVANDERSIQNTPGTDHPSTLIGLPADWPGKPFEQADRAGVPAIPMSARDEKLGQRRDARDPATKKAPH
jgi:hypothetical protein